MSLDKKDFSNYIKQFNFRELFNDMGWNNDKTTQPIVVDNETYTLQAVAEKCGLKILTSKVENLPTTPTRKKLDTQIRKLFYHYLLICIDGTGNQKWIIPIKKSEGRDLVTIDYASHQVPEFLYQKVSQLTFALEQEEHLTIVDVSKLINDTFIVNSEKITKQFYDKFKKEHGAFLQFIKGISDKTNQEWYASLMLNRLMFCYFIQKKGFLDNNKNYLRDKLNACLRLRSDSKNSNKKEPAERSRSQFYSFYRNFLLVLFHKGLNEPPENRRKLSGAETEVVIEIGKIPYLNGGLFDEHELEKTNASIDIDDKAFERLFDFFDQYEWHLDTRHTASGKDINPDVIGYIFEKYINDRANMGAYYTKEDITDYISKNCILPYLFDETFRSLRLRSGSGRLSEAETELWQMVKQSGDLYIYDAVKKGVEEPLPKEIVQGIKDVSKRTEWNTSASLSAPRMALPTEIWREVVDRRNRYTEVKSKIDKGDIQQINDFITYNLNIRQFAQDVVENTNDPELLKHFYKALSSVTIIDPTCGSGAFLFAAMNILEPLYEACLQRMEIFLEEAKDEKNYKHLPPELQKSWKSINHSTSWFRQVLAQVKSPEHPNLQYFIYKSIILRNLYGVDIMKEAVEIAKLRLFLKLVATVEADYRKPNLGLEPLPDIDFNIRAGNTLVGFATEAELQNAFAGKLDFDNDTEKIKEKCDIVARAYERYKTIQLTGQASDFAKFKAAKDELNQRLAALNHELNIILCKEQGITYDDKNPAILESYKSWFRQYQPFHWFAEFYEIIHDKGGFDVIIGNPPYVEYSKVRDSYKIKSYETETCGNLYAFVIERSAKLLRKFGKMGFIIPLSSVSTPRMEILLGMYAKKKYLLFSSFYAGDSNPSLLFSGVKSQLSIQLISDTNENISFVTNYIRWFDEFRSSLFEWVFYTKSEIAKNKLLKIGTSLEQEILAKMKKQAKSVAEFFTNHSKETLFFRNASGSYYRLFLTEPPKLFINGISTTSSTLKELKLIINSKVAHCLFSSNLFHWYWTVISDNYHITKKEFSNFFFDATKLDPTQEIALKSISENLTNDYESKSKYRIETDNRTGAQRKVQIFEPRKSKPIIDDIDKILAKHYGFTDEELDFIINYDIKYRMGKELEGEDEE